MLIVILGSDVRWPSQKVINIMADLFLEIGNIYSAICYVSAADTDIYLC